MQPKGAIMIDHTSYVDALLLLAALGSLSRHKAPTEARVNAKMRALATDVEGQFAKRKSRRARHAEIEHE